MLNNDYPYSVQIWSRSHLVKNVDVLACEKHGKIFEDGEYLTFRHEIFEFCEANLLSIFCLVYLMA